MKLALVGDIALFRLTSKEGNPNWNTYFKEVSNVLAQADYVVGNLETPFSKERKTYGAKSAYICASPENVAILKMLHIDAVTLANNHIYDYGKEAFDLTRHTLDDVGIEWFGINGKALLLKKYGNKIAFTGFCSYSTNPQKCVKYGKKGVNEFDLRDAKKILYQYHKQGYLNVCAIHAGIEHVNYPSIDTVNAVNQMSSIAPIIYYGHHPHTVQPIIRKENSLIAYSLGNFCFDDVYTKGYNTTPLIKLSENNRTSVILVVTIEANKIVDYNIIPIYIGKDKIHTGQGIGKLHLEHLAHIITNVNTGEYERERTKQRANWIKTRRKKRNAVWLLKRLRLRYLVLFVTNRINVCKYNKHVRRYL